MKTGKVETSSVYFLTFLKNFLNDFKKSFRNFL